MATDVLRGALNTDAKSPVERFGGVLTGGSIRERGKEARKAMPTIMQESAQAAGQAKRIELEATNQQLGREAAVEEQAATKLRAETERIRGLEQPYQEFKAPEYTAADYAKGAAKRALVGVLLGGIAKTSAMTQLKAIKAMQDAERDGRTQDFEKARLSFDEAEKKRVDFNQRLQTELSDFQQLLGKDTAAAKLKAKMMTAQMMDGLASAAERNSNYKQFTEILTNATKQSDELEMEEFKKQARLEEARAKPQKIEQLPSGIEKTLEKVGSANVSLNRANQTKEPEFFGVAPSDTIADLIVSGVEKGLPVGDIMRGLGVNAPKVTRASVEWWKDYQSFVAKVRNELFGATLTEREASDFRKFNIGPATAPDVAEDYFRRQIGIIKKAVERERRKAQARGVSDQTISAYLDLPEDEVQAPAAPAAAPVNIDKIPRINTQQEYDALEPGSEYIDAQTGTRSTKPGAK